MKTMYDIDRHGIEKVTGMKWVFLFDNEQQVFYRSKLKFDFGSWFGYFTLTFNCDEITGTGKHRVDFGVVRIIMEDDALEGIFSLDPDYERGKEKKTMETWFSQLSELIICNYGEAPISHGEGDSFMEAFYNTPIKVTPQFVTAGLSNPCGINSTGWDILDLPYRVIPHKKASVIEHII